MSHFLRSFVRGFWAGGEWTTRFTPYFALGTITVTSAFTGVGMLINPSLDISNYNVVDVPGMGLNAVTTVWGIMLGDVSSLTPDEMLALLQHEEHHVWPNRISQLGMILFWLAMGFTSIRYWDWKKKIAAMVIVVSLNANYQRWEEANADHAVQDKDAMCMMLDKLYRTAFWDLGLEEDWTHGGSDRLNVLGCIADESSHGE